MRDRLFHKAVHRFLTPYGVIFNSGFHSDVSNCEVRMITFNRTNSDNADFVQLVGQLDTDLAERDGIDHAFYSAFNRIDKIKQVIVAFEDHTPVACGAIKEFSGQTMEVKRMYTVPAYRGRGIATGILAELERWAAELGYKTCVLETGKRQPEAIRVYQKNGYRMIENYGQYAGIDNSVCFQKELSY